MTAQRIGSYEIVRTLARGGMAVVYLARQATLDREVALKRLDFEGRDPALALRFVREAHFVAALDHPNVVTVFDFFEHDGVPYIAMEYVRGGSLRPFIGRLGLPQIFSVLEGVLAGLGHAEERGIAHRDLKPENVLITRRGAVKIADFGIARAYGAVTDQLTRTGTAIGTPAYMAPEQAQSGRLGPYTDLYAVGVIAYELLAGRPPFAGTTPVAVLYAHVHETPPPLVEVAPDAPSRVREWVDWLLAKEPAERPGSAMEAWEALEEIVVAGLGPYWRRAATITAAGPFESPPRGEPEATAIALDTTADSPPATATREDPRRPPVPAAPRRRLRTVGAAVVVAAATAVTALLASGSDDPEQPPQAAKGRAATGLDFDGDGRQELVLALPKSSPREADDTSGVVIVHKGPGAGPPTLITSGDAGLSGPPGDGDLFGAGLASGDFDRDGRADLAIGVPGRETVAVLYGTPQGLGGGREQVIAAADTRLPRGAGRYGAVAADDLDGDGYADLAIGAPGTPSGQVGTGAIQIAFGSPRGLRLPPRRLIRRPDDTYADFGSRVRVGDIDGDGHVDLIAGAPDRGGGPAGHAVFCPGSARGPISCRILGALGRLGTTSLAVADVDRNGFEDILQGDGGGETDGGEVRLWLGGRRGPAAQPITIDQDTKYVRGKDEPGDGFGSIVDVANLDADDFADMVVAAPGEDDEKGSVTIIRGGRNGFAGAGGSVFHRDDPDVPGTAEPGDRFGSALGLLRLSDDDRLDLVVAAGGVRRLADAVTVIEGGPGIFAPSEVRAVRLGGLGRRVRPLGLDRIRVARPGRH